MFGTVARFRIKKGMESQFDKLTRDLEARRPAGWMSANIYRSKNDPQEYWTAVVYRDEASYRNNADDPEQQKWFAEMSKLLESEPEWHDGEVVHSAHTH